jgi:hypothetical protein
MIVCPSASLFFGSHPSGKRSSVSQTRKSFTSPPKIEYISAAFPEPSTKACTSEQGKVQIAKGAPTKELMQEAPGQRVLAVGTFTLGTAQSGDVGEIVDREGLAVRCVGEELVYELAVREALVGAEGDVRTCAGRVSALQRPVWGVRTEKLTRERGIVLDDLQDQGSACSRIGQR